MVIFHQQPICRIQNQQELPLGSFQKLSVQIREICLPKGVKDWIRPFWKAFSKYKSFCHLTANILLIWYKIKGTVQIFSNICWISLLTKTYQTILLILNLISCPSPFKMKEKMDCDRALRMCRLYSQRATDICNTPQGYIRSSGTLCFWTVIVPYTYIDGRLIS